MKRGVRIGIIFLGVILLGVVAMRFFMNHQHGMHHGASHNIPMADFGLLPDFTLIDQKDKEFGSADLKGSPWIGNFIFTRCTGPCPIMSSHMATLISEFSDQPRIQYVSFSVDPEYDTPTVLSAYAKRYQANPNQWRFLTGETKKVHEIILDGFRLAIQENNGQNSPVGEKVIHSLHFVLVDQKGHVRGYYNGYDADARQRLRDNLKELL